MRSWKYVLLAVSLLFNVFFGGGYLYQRLVLQPRAQLAWSVDHLHLDDSQRAALMQLQRWSRDSLRLAAQEARADIELVQSGLRTAQADDPRMQQAMQRLGEKRIVLQREGLSRLLQFRDSLRADQRELFATYAQDRSFYWRLMGYGQASPRS